MAENRQLALTNRLHFSAESPYNPGKTWKNERNDSCTDPCDRHQWRFGRSASFGRREWRTGF